MLARAVFRSKILASISLGTTMSKPSRSHSSSSYSDDIEKLFRYTRGRWLYNERERESHFFCDSFCLVLKPSPALHEMQKMTYVIPVSILRNLRRLHVKPREPVLARSLQSLKKASFHFSVGRFIF
jgi:hypothetical protein